MPRHSLKVKLMIRAKDANAKWRFLPATNKSGQLKPVTPLYGLLNKKTKETKYCGEGVYYLRYVEDKLPKFKTASDVLKEAGKPPARTKDPTPGELLAEAEAAIILCQRRLGAKASNIVVVSPHFVAPVVDQLAVPSLGPDIAAWLDKIKTRKAYRTYLAYRLAVTQFGEHCKKSTISAIRDQDIFYFADFLRDGLKLKPRTVFNRVVTVKRLMLHYKCPWPIKEEDMPKYTERVPTAYDQPELLDLVQKATQDERDLIAFFCHVGTREQEAEFACYTDFDFTKLQFKVQEKDDFPEFIVKGRRARAIPAAPELLTVMLARRNRYPNSRLIFPLPSGKPDGHFLRKVKDLALRAGLNCGHCHTRKNKKGLRKCCDKHAVCKKWTLHDFRRTFATVKHAEGATFKEIHDWLGHERLETTNQYLKSPAPTEKTWKAINAAFRGLAKILD